MLVNCAQRLALPRAGFAFPLILRLGVGDRLPLEIGNRIRSAAGERLDVIFAVARTGAAGFPGRWARMLPLEFPRHLTRSVLFRRNRGHGEHNRSRNDQGEQFRGSAHYSARVALIDRARWSRWSARLSKRAARCSISFRASAKWQDPATSRSLPAISR